MGRKHIIVVVGASEEPTFQAGRKAVIDNGVVVTKGDDEIGAATFWVCPRVEDDCSRPPYDIGACTECGAAITYRDTPRLRACIAPDARKICQPCALALSRK